jgi:uncharacterized membrane protein
MQQSVTKKRIEFIDLLRGWAVIVMIQTHVFNATLTPGLTETGFFQVLRFIDGLVAPSFLFASGMAYAVTTRRKINDYLSFGPPLFRQFGRLLFVMLIGYGLHLPKLTTTISATRRGLSPGRCSGRSTFCSALRSASCSSR